MTKSIIKPSPALLFLTPFSYGIFLSRPFYGLSKLDYLSIHLLFWLFFIFCLLNCFKTFSYFKIKTKRANLILIALSATLVVYLGHLHAIFFKEKLLKDNNRLIELTKENREECLIGTVISTPTPSSSGANVKILIEYVVIGERLKTPIFQNAIINFKGLSWRIFRPGTRIKFFARLFEIRNFGTPGTFDFVTYWSIRGIKVRGYCRGALFCTFLKTQAKYNYIQKLFIAIEQIRFYLITSIFKTMEKEKAPIAIALLLGQRSFMEKETKELISASGIGHLFAVSGLHMAIVGLITYNIIKWLLSQCSWLLLKVNIRKLAYVASIASCGIYCAFSGFSPSSLRAFIMVTFIGLCFILERKSQFENFIAIAAWLLIFYNPYYLFDISFQLSFLTVFFLFYLGRPFFENIQVKNILIKLFIITCLAFLITAPLILFYFHRINPYSILLNFLCVPLVEFIILPLLLFGLMLIHLDINIPFLLASKVINILQSILSLPFTTNYLYSFWSPLKLSEIIFLFIILLLLPVLIKRNRFLWLVFIIIFFIFHSYFYYERQHRKYLTLHVLDVGQGLSQVIELPDGRAILIDTAGIKIGGFDSGKMVVAPFLRTIGISSLEKIIISHPEIDHIGGLVAILKEFKVKELWLNSDENTNLEEYKEVLRLCYEKRIKLRRITTNIKWDFSKNGSLYCYALKKEELFKRNDKGLVIKVRYGNSSFLLTGDIEIKREKLLIKNYDLSDVSLMVVPHHGSNTSNSLEFLNHIKPIYAICSTGYKNIFKLPSKKVENRYKQLGIRFLRTDELGTISVKFYRDGRLSINSYYKGRII